MSKIILFYIAVIAGMAWALSPLWRKKKPIVKECENCKWYEDTGVYSVPFPECFNPKFNNVHNGYRLTVDCSKNKNEWEPL